MLSQVHQLINTSALLAIIFGIFGPYVQAAGGRPPPPPVPINKCCRIGEQLDRSLMCAAGGSEKWVPLVYMMGRNVYFQPEGTAPRFFKIQENQRPTMCREPELFSGPTSVVIFSNGSLYLTEKSIFIPAEDYCAEKHGALVCFPQIHGSDSLIAPKKLSKVRKCCAPNSAFIQSNKTCIGYRMANEAHSVVSVVNSSSVEIIFGFPDCEDYALAGRFRSEHLNIENGSLSLDTGKMVDTNDFCLEHTIRENKKVYDDTTSNLNIFACSKHFTEPAKYPPDVVIDANARHYVWYSAGLLISVIFLSATLATGFFLMPSNHHVLHWRCQTYYVACLLVGDLLLSTTLIAQNSISGASCIVLATVMHFSFLSAFFWLNTMCFNIWWTFRDFRPTSLEKGQELFRLRIYIVYAIGGPLIITFVALLLDFLPESPKNDFIRPHFGESGCWFRGDEEILVYFFGPIGVLLSINVLLFLLTARQLTCGLWKRDDVKSTTERAALGKVCLKLVIVMGVTWVADILSWAAGGPGWLWYVTDAINALQGVFIFIVVGCQPQVWSALKRIWSSKTGRGVTNTTNGPQHSSSSHGLPSIGETVTNNTLTNTTSTKVPMETVC